MSDLDPMYAVLITLGGYQHARDLAGPPNDLARMQALCADTLGLRPEDVRAVATSAGGWQGGTRADVLAALDWLSAKLDDPKSTAILHFSGHGTRLTQPGRPESLALCASDYQAGDGAPAERGLVTLEDIAGKLGGATLPDPGAAANELALVEAVLQALAGTKLARVTMIADCCWHDDGVGSAVPVSMPLLTYRMLLGCSRGDVANEVRCDGRPMGAFTWAVCVALSRFRIVQVDGQRQSTVTHADLMDRVRRLLDGIGVARQTPMLGGPRVLDLIPVFQRELTWRDDAPVSRAPDVIDDHRQLWEGETGSRTYYLSWRTSSTDPNGWTPVGIVVATGDETPKNTEAWTISKPNALTWLTSVHAGTRGELKWSTTAHSLPGPTGGWSYTRETTPTACAAGTVTGSHLYALITAAGGRALLKLGVSKTATGFTFDTLQWYCRSSDLKSDDTFDAVFGSTNRTYPGQTSVTVTTSHSVFPAQSAGGLAV